MFKLAPLSAAVVLAIAGQVMADDSLSTQSQQGKANIAEVQQTVAPYASATQDQNGQGHNHLAVQDTSTSDISQSATGSFNAGYADQILENGSKTLQRSGGSLNDNFSSQSLGQDNQVLQVQQGTGNMSRVFQEFQTGAQATTLQQGSANDAVVEQLIGGTNNRAQIMQEGTGNTAAAEHILHDNGDIRIGQKGQASWAYGDQRNGLGGTIDIQQVGSGHSVEVWQDTQVASQASVYQQGQLNEGYTHGMSLVIENVRQLRHQADDSCPGWERGEHTYDHREGGCRQVEKCEVTMNMGWGTPAVSSALILRR